MKSLLLIMTFSFVVSAQGATTKKAKSHLSQDINFEDQLIRGKYAYPDEAIATVEDDKWLNDLLSVRKNFRDRLGQSALRN